VGVSAAPQAAFEVELKVAIILSDLNHVTKSLAAQWGRGPRLVWRITQLH